METPKACWYCGKGPLTSDNRGARCENCGATWSPVVILGPEIMEVHRDPTHRLPTIHCLTSAGRVRDDNGEMKHPAPKD